MFISTSTLHWRAISYNNWTVFKLAIRWRGKRRIAKEKQNWSRLNNWINWIKYFNWTLVWNQRRNNKTTKKNKKVFQKTIYGFYIILFRSQKSFESGDENGLTAENCALLADLVEINQSLIVFAVRNSKNHSLVDRLIQLNKKNERIHFFDLFKGMVNIKPVLLSWFSLENPILRGFYINRK